MTLPHSRASDNASWYMPSVKCQLRK